jgi:hypothetical protein
MSERKGKTQGKITKTHSATSKTIEALIKTVGKATKTPLVTTKTIRKIIKTHQKII